MNPWNREKLEREDLFARQGANMPIDKWKWLARRSVTSNEASLLLVGISPVGYHELYTNKDHWQEEAIWLIQRLCEEEQVADMPLIDWYLWAAQHPQLRHIPGVMREAEPVIEAFDNMANTMPAPQAPQEETPKQAPDKPLHHRRRQTYLKLIEGLALRALGGDIPTEPYTAAVALQSILESHGLKLDDEPIAKTVKEIQAARNERDSDPY